VIWNWWEFALVAAVFVLPLISIIVFIAALKTML
jgi:hypothetical protein